MDILISKDKGRVPVTIFAIQGEVTVDSYEQLQEQAEEAYRSGMRDLLLDLSDVTFLSSSGLRAIHYIFMLLRDSKDKDDEIVRKGVAAGTYKSPNLKILKPADNVLQTLKLSGFDMFLDIHSDLKEAIASF
jgi:hypothetical protein